MKKSVFYAKKGKSFVQTHSWAGKGAPVWELIVAPTGKETAVVAVKRAFIHGCDFGDRLLEGVYFEVVPLAAKNGFEVRTSPDEHDYLDDLNMKKWLKLAASIAENKGEEGMFDGQGRRCEAVVWLHHALEAGHLPKLKGAHAAAAKAGAKKAKAAPSAPVGIAVAAISPMSMIAKLKKGP